ncbi:MAG: hypothetical protein ACYC61_31560 [Isosphaeraceae bacterium]
MARDPDIRRALEEFAEVGEKHAFEFRGGGEFLGWVLEVTSDAALVRWAPSPFYAQAAGTEEMAPSDRWVPLADIIPESLAYWDDERRGWCSYPRGEPCSPAPEPRPIPWWRSFLPRVTRA